MFQPPLCSDFDKSEDMVFLEKDTCDEVFQSPFPLPRYVTKDVAKKCVACPRWFAGKSLLFEFKDTLNSLRRSLVPQSFDLSLRSCQSSSRFLFIPSHTLRSDEVQGGQSYGPSSQPLDSFPLHNHFQRWIEQSFGNVTWHDFVPPSYLHELYFMISYDIMYILTCVIFLLDLCLFWFMMKHKDRYCDTMLAWLYWLYDYT
jgi:hypothetical protein